MNSFGRNFRVSIFGESHGDVVGITLDGVRAGIALCAEDFTTDLKRRQGGSGAGTTPRKESDTPHLVSGILNAVTTGAPLTILFHNENKHSKDYSNLALHPRPSHADWVATQKWNAHNDIRGGGHFSGRLTLGVVAAGVVAKKMLGEGVTFSTKITSIGGQSENYAELIREIEEAQDSIGGVIECRVSGVEAGVGSPFFDSVESVAAHLLFSIPAVKGVEFGSGFAAAKMRGSQHNDEIVNAQGQTLTNNAGGVVGGITNGNEIVARVAIKPTASIGKEQQTFRYDDTTLQNGEVATLKIEGRHDSCIALRAAVVVEAALAMTIAELIDKT